MTRETFCFLTRQLFTASSLTSNRAQSLQLHGAQFGAVVMNTVSIIVKISAFAKEEETIAYLPAH
jgi:hypothetical protein